MTYIKVDQLGLYVRFGDTKIMSLTKYDWGGVYYAEKPKTPAFDGYPMDYTQKQPDVLAFEVHPWKDVPWTHLAGLLKMNEHDLRAECSVVALMRGSACEPQRDQ